MSNKKNLLIYAHYYIPDTASTGQILRELAEGMLDKFDITVICVVPSYLGTIEDKYKTQKYYEEEINGVKVLRIRVPEFSKTNKKSRVKNIVSYFFGAMGATFKVGKMDYVFSMRTYRCAVMQELDRIKQLVSCLVDGDPIRIKFAPGEDNSAFDTLHIPEKIELDAQAFILPSTQHSAILKPL